MTTTSWVVIACVTVVIVIVAITAVRIVSEYQRGVVLRFGKLAGTRDPGLRVIIPLADRMIRVSMRVVTMPIQSQGIITRDNVSVDISAVAYYRVVDPVKAVVEVEDVHAAINQIAQTTLRKVVGRHSLDDALAHTDTINDDIRRILEMTVQEWGVEVRLVELKDIQLPGGMQRAMAREAEAEREKRAKIIAAEGEAVAAHQLSTAAKTMADHPIALQLRSLQTLIEIGVEKNTTVVFPAPLMSSLADLDAFLSREMRAHSHPSIGGDGADVTGAVDRAAVPAARTRGSESAPCTL
ncbi:MULTISPECIES: slipin family protein [unclassified Gordonia (in: high G+C Gram-positive bacteria)]|uniref:slipin family protein n=1 Tax=Gordonia TaxID=2053 RepID=UPI00071C6C2C|nr:MULTISPECIES: slipin family protein [unclassified Gordonia (in: high G+C Gram-positive bacteria)]KSU58219.1 band 7 domain-containing protein [Gordonia sp. SGD-V-85]MBR7194758.1 slipin family protein [Gordonia sp. SCSIO 19800]MDT0223240.1 slipin family protein [Gordonia sp. AC31]SCC27540.1 Regulator of protease activity HflC, stomatin/prohibitin superfamily [Gordonia sp. v-85]